MTTTRKFLGPLADTEWKTGLAITFDRLDEAVADELRRVPVQPSGEHSVLAEQAALARVADRKTAECVAFARRNGLTWAWIGTQIGVTPQAAQQRFGKLPVPPIVLAEDHGPECAERMVPEQLRRDRTAWGCRCGAVGELD